MVDPTHWTPSAAASAAANVTSLVFSLHSLLPGSFFLFFPLLSLSLSLFFNGVGRVGWNRASLSAGFPWMCSVVRVRP